MRKILKVARREYLATVRTKGFIIGLVLAPLLMSGSLIVMALFRDRTDTRDRHVAVVDRSGLVADALVRAAAERNARDTVEAPGRPRQAAYLIEVVRPNARDSALQRLLLSDRVRAKELHAFVEVGPQALHPGGDTTVRHLAYYSQNAALDETRGWIAGQVNTTLRRLRLQEAGIDTATVPDLFRNLEGVQLGLLTRDPATGRITDAQTRNEGAAVFVPMALMLLMFMMLMWGAMPQLNATMQEKSQRIAEVVLGSVRPFEFMAGKLLGGVAIAMTASAVYVGAGLYALTVMGLSGLMPLSVVAWFFVYMLLAVAMYGALFAAVGSACNDPVEAQSIAFVAMLPMIIPTFLLLPVVTQPNGAFATGMSLVPLWTPMLMLMRQATPGGVPAWQPWAALAGVVATTLLLVWAGGRVFRVAILMQGTPPKLANLVRWAIRG
jgi:ABC-2 type transport system permease protein